ncbi:hypothetical protein ACSDQ9_02155 [Aestuariimicrobium soli]|uniref:hypothetical protein n=1 Tax=Aestuariimicrobium soli TaxID=2035834 RepID=UPI003EBC7089
MTEPEPTPRSLLTEQAEAPRPFVDPHPSDVPAWARGLGLYLVVCLLGGLLAGFIWNVVVVRPEYVMGDDSVASTTERGLTQFFVADSWFVIIGLVAGALIGWFAWLRYGRHGWPVVPMAVVGALVAAALAWGFGVFLDSGDFETRIAAAKAGDHIPIELALKARTALLVWPVAALLPILAAASLSDDEAGPGLVTRVRLRRAHRRMAAAMAAQRPLPQRPQPQGVQAASGEQADEAEQHRGDHQPRGQVGDADRANLEQS